MDVCIHTCDNMIMCHNPTGKWPKWNIYIYTYVLAIVAAGRPCRASKGPTGGRRWNGFNGHQMPW